MEEAKVETKLEATWEEAIDLLKELRRVWTIHVGLVHRMNMDYVNPKLQRHLAHGFNRADFYLALPDLIEYARSVGGIEYLQIEKEKSDARGKESGKAGTQTRR